MIGAGGLVVGIVVFGVGRFSIGRSRSRINTASISTNWVGY